MTTDSPIGESDGPTIGGEPVRVETWPSLAIVAAAEAREVEAELDMLAHDLYEWQHTGLLDLRREHARSILDAARLLRGFLARQRDIHA